MPRFVQKPVVVDAEQWYPGEKIAGVIANWDNNPMTPNKCSIRTKTGWVDLYPGMWIVINYDGTLLVFDRTAFNALYDSFPI